MAGGDGGVQGQKATVDVRDRLVPLAVSGDVSAEALAREHHSGLVNVADLQKSQLDLNLAIPARAHNDVVVLNYITGLVKMNTMFLLHLVPVTLLVTGQEKLLRNTWYRSTFLLLLQEMPACSEGS